MEAVPVWGFGTIHLHAILAGRFKFRSEADFTSSIDPSAFYQVKQGFSSALVYDPMKRISRIKILCAYRLKMPFCAAIRWLLLS